MSTRSELHISALEAPTMDLDMGSLGLEPADQGWRTMAAHANAQSPCRMQIALLAAPGSHLAERLSSWRRRAKVDGDSGMLCLRLGP